MDASIVVAGIAAIASTVATIYTARGARSSARITADSAASTRAEELRQQQIDQLRASLEAIIGRLNDEVAGARGEMQRLREQLDHEESVSDALRRRVRELEDKVHEMQMTINELQHQLAVYSAQHPLARPAERGEPHV